MKRNIFLYAVLSLFTVTTATGCDERSDNPMPDSAIRVETAEVTAITSENAISGGRIIGETQAVKEFGICWATTDNPTVSDNHNVGAGDANSFACYATGLSANATYSVRIKSFKKTTATTYFSDYLTFSADTRIPNVTSLTYKADSASQVTLSWSRNTAADGYTVEIYRGGKWEQVLCATSNTKLSCKITGLAEGSTYSVRIKSYKGKNGRTVFSEYLKSTATTGLNPVAKLGEQTNSTASSIRFSWARKSCATGYIVEIYKGGKWNLVTKTTSNTVTSCQITNLNAGTSYTCRVRAYLTVNGSTIYSDNVRTVQTTK